jgi:FkbH-like protein
MNPSIVEFPWLPDAPDDFASLCRRMTAADVALGTQVRYLATHRLTDGMSSALGRAIRRCRNSGASFAPLSQFRLGVLSNATMDIVADSLPAASARHGIDLEVTIAPFDQVMQQALDSDSEINRGNFDAVLLALDHHWARIGDFELGAGERRINEVVQRYSQVIKGLRERGRCPAIVQTVALPACPLFGSLDRRMKDTPRAVVEKINRRLADLCDETGAYLFDVAALADRVGIDRWFDLVKWHHFKLPFSSECNQIYADALGRILGAIRGKARKCLVLDLDNTLWGGAVGDEGVDGIEVGQGSPMGEAFTSVQQAALALNRRGIMLAVCSKNNYETAIAPFQQHPDMLLSESHISVFQANWLDKPSNLEAIAKTLNIGLDAVVFLDDNPAERAQVRAALPMVAVPELPADPSWYPWMLSAAGYFESVGFSDEDARRSASYAADAKRAEVMTQARDLGDYLSSLKMEIGFSSFDVGGRQRITQLINKSNQFNLTTRRYTEAQIAELEIRPDVFTLQVRLSDAWGALGMIGVVICTEVQQESVWYIDTWLMSCRVLGRKVEEAMLAELVRNARNRDIKCLRGIYLPTDKNNMVADHYDKLGFSLIEEQPKGVRLYDLQLDGYQIPALPFAVEHRLPG